jgi:competence protein ComEA
LDRTQKRWIIVIILATVIIVGSLYSDWQKQAAPEPAPAGPRAEGPRPGDGAEAVVYVSGGVARPGLYKVPLGNRVTDAVDAAGGLAEGADTAKLNMAQFVKDGMHVYVPVRSAPAHRAVSPAAAVPPDKPNADKININTADAGQLQQLPGIGPVLAGRIIEYRKAKGPFRDRAELKLVPGIGDAKYNELKDRITL